MIFTALQSDSNGGAWLEVAPSKAAGIGSRPSLLTSVGLRFLSVNKLGLLDNNLIVFSVSHH